MHRSPGVGREGIAYAVVLAAILGSNGCIGRSAPGAHVPDSLSAPEPDRQNAEVTILVRNRHWLDVTVYLIRGSATERLGTAAGLSESVISLPWRRVEGAGTIRLGADPIGQARGVITETILVRPSSVVDWTIESGLRGFHVSVF